MRWNRLNLLFAILLLLSSSARAGCLDSINPVFGANPSFFNMSDRTNQEILSQNISAGDKFYLLVYNTFPETPLLQNIRDYNLLLPFSCPPNGTDVIDKSYIHSVWLRAITVMPSVMDEDGNYWALPDGEVLSAYNYSIKLPRSATNAYPDCGVVYSLLSSSSQFSVYANGKYAGSSTLVSYTVNSTNLNATAELSVSASVRKDYYTSDCYCCESDKNGCKKTCCSCDFSRTEVENESATLSSSLERKVYFLEASPNLTMLQCPAGGFGAAWGNFSLNTTVPIQSFLLSFGAANASLQSHKLDIMLILKPHNALEAQSVAQGYESSDGMLISESNTYGNFTQLNFTGVPQDGARASYAGLALTDLFGISHNFSNYTAIVCPVNPEIELTMPHWAEKGADFQVAVRLSAGGDGIGGKSVSLYYSGREYNGTTNSDGEAVFTVKAYESLVVAKSEYDGRYADVKATGNLMVYKPSIISFVLSILAFLFILVLSYIAIRTVGGWNL